MLNATEQQEREHFAKIRTKLQAALDAIAGEISQRKEALKETSGDLWEFTRDAARDIDSIVQMTELTRQQSTTADSGERLLQQRQRLIRMARAPYFGRLDFYEESAQQTEPEAFYIGIHSLINTESIEVHIHDWRAPVSGMFYDFELGKAFYHAPAGKIEGELTGKRQYKVAKGELEYYIDTSLNISDDILKKTLAGKSDERMKNIVETIQREQNVIIRDDDAETLVIQGVAGSGKTSVALHRTAYMLYKYKDTLSSAEILIISPSGVFADYIADVLPELGEEQLEETDMDSIAGRELGKTIKLQSRYEQTAMAVEGGDSRLSQRMRWKSRVELIGELDSFISNLGRTCFHAKEIDIDGYKITEEFIQKRFVKYSNDPLQKRLELIHSDIREEITIHRSARDARKWNAHVKQSLDKMLKLPPLIELYGEFYRWIGKPEYFRLAGKNKPEYSDVFPLLYLKSAVEGISIYKNVKHLIVDEMQDYAPIEYAVLRLMFPCKATILGDKLQSISPQNSTGEAICSVFPGAKYVELSKCYRSTYEIAEFAGRIFRDEKLICVERHGEAPKLVACMDSGDEMRQLVELTGAHDGDGSYGVICKTSAQAADCHAALLAGGVDAWLLSERSVKLSSGVIVTTPLAAKGLEFDRVAIPGADAGNYSSEMDRRLLYISCTRAMHELTILHSGEVTKHFG